MLISLNRHHKTASSGNVLLQMHNRAAAECQGRHKAVQLARTLVGPMQFAKG